MADIIVIGGGAAGMMAAIAAAQKGHRVRLYEKNEKLGKKVYITGKGRCNVTNACDREEFFQNIVTNPKFMFSAFGQWSNWDMYNYLTDRGLPLKIERGNRVFPESDHSSDVIRTLQRAMDAEGVDWKLNTRVTGLIVEPIADPDITAEESGDGTANDIAAERSGDGTANDGAGDEAAAGRTAGNAEDGLCLSGNPSAGRKKAKKKKSSSGNKGPGQIVRGVILEHDRRVTADCVIVATGGLSYPSTGSTGDGYSFAKAAGHQVTELYPALVPFDAVFADGSSCKELQGLALKNIAVRIQRGDKVLATDFGEMLFTHFGVSGPVILTASNKVTSQMKSGELDLWLDLKPALTEEQLDNRLLRELELGANKQMNNLMGSLLPAKMIPVMLRYAKISPEKKGREVTREERLQLLQALKNFRIRLLRTRNFNEAIITQGGISVKEVVPSTMESRLVKNLYFAGEVLDVDAFTGGYNLQVAWSTGYAAGSAAGKS